MIAYRIIYFIKIKLSNKNIRNESFYKNNSIILSIKRYFTSIY
ncbi:hypothetical protein A1OE_1133 [Candidatus Endolissoclinum faulkneri L2]|uniref:Uncharacterized protein n=1 Tax=Candidatus Endolissoclinum faulkneri L2 TaxID=1193729 RepID=K7ZD91_9PROT|nr:hypothetical protein A1OE_1133 [Candidatus Endolissoclinum faulkneri L2]